MGDKDRLTNRDILPPVLAGVGAMIYITEEENWPAFYKWLEETHPEAIPNDGQSENMREGMQACIAGLLQINQLLSSAAILQIDIPVPGFQPPKPSVN